MQKSRVKYVVALATVGVLGFGGAAVAHDRESSNTEGRLTGFEEVPALSTPGSGDFRAALNRSGDTIRYRLSFDNLESPATQAHIHFENHTNNGPIVVFLCSNITTTPPPAGTQGCPAGGGTISGTIRSEHVGAGAAGNGIAAGEFDEFVRAIRAGSTYVNVHSVNRVGGEIRAQLGDKSKRSNDHDH